MLKNSKKKLRKLGAFSLVLAQVAAVGVVAPMTSASAFARQCNHKKHGKP